MMEGYLFCETPGNAFHAKETFPTIRYAAQLDDGSGFAAFDWYHPSLHEFGEVRTISPQVQSHIPWPWNFPKRALATPDDWFARLAMDDTDALEGLEDVSAIRGLVILDDDSMLIESRGPIVLQSDGLNAKVRYYEQDRTEARLPV
jgi:hypothetical protein